MSGPQLDRRRLALVAARFDSSHDGERLAALEAFGRILRAGGASWADVIRAPADEPESAAKVEGRDPSHLEIITALSRDGDLLTAWECRFLQGCADMGHLSDKQWRTLSEITAKVQAVQSARGMSA